MLTIIRDYLSASDVLYYCCTYNTVYNKMLHMPKIEEHKYTLFFTHSVEYSIIVRLTYHSSAIILGILNSIHAQRNKQQQLNIT